MITIEDVDKSLYDIQQSEIHMAKNYYILAKEIKDPKLRHQFLHMELEEYEHLHALKELMILLVENWREKNDN